MRQKRNYCLSRYRNKGNKTDSNFNDLDNNNNNEIKENLPQIQPQHNENKNILRRKRRVNINIKNIKMKNNKKNINNNRKKNINNKKNIESNILINEDKIVFENLVKCSTDKLKLIYKLTNNDKMKNKNEIYNKIKKEKNIYINVKTKDNEIFGSYIKEIRVNKTVNSKDTYLFSLNNKVIISTKQNIDDSFYLEDDGLSIGKSEMRLFDNNNECYLDFDDNGIFNYDNITSRDLINKRMELYDGRHVVKFIPEYLEIYVTESHEYKNDDSSRIINSDNKNTFESLICSMDKLKLLYQMSRDGNNKESMQNKIQNHSNIIAIVKTNENKVFGGYTSMKIEYGNRFIKDNEAYLYSVDLNEKYRINDAEHALSLNNGSGLSFGTSQLVLFNLNNKCYCEFTSDNIYDINENDYLNICGGIKRNEFDVYDFQPIEIEIYEMIGN